MKKNLRGKIREFVQSEEGKVGVKSPLTLGVATGGILLAQTIVGTSVEAGGLCYGQDDCDGDEVCASWYCWDTPEGQKCAGSCIPEEWA